MKREQHIAVVRVRAASRSSQASARRALTLLEVLLALVLLAMMVAMMNEFYWNALRVRKAGSKVMRDAVLARRILNEMATEIRQASSNVPGFGPGIRAENTEQVEIYTLAMPSNVSFDEYDPLQEELPPAEADVRMVKYQLLWDEENTDENGDPVCLGLSRIEQKTLNQAYVVYEGDGGSGDGERKEDDTGRSIDVELYAPEIKYLEILYFDGGDWTDRWKADGGDTLPQAIWITIGRVPLPPEDREFDISVLDRLEKDQDEDEEHPDRFTMIMRLPQADVFLSSRLANARDQMGRLREGG